MVQTDRSHHFLTVGWSVQVIRRLADPLAEATGFRFSHILDPAVDRHTPDAPSGENLHCIREDHRQPLPAPDHELLGSLEGPEIPTIHNMILGDRRVRTLPYESALAYATGLARRLEELFVRIEPSVVIGGFDGLHSGIALAVARKLGLPWFALNFTTIPLGMSGFCTGMSPATSISCLEWEPETLRALAEKTLAEFETRQMTVPAYLSANSLAMVLQRLPRHLRILADTIRRAAAGRADVYTQTPLKELVRAYVRKRKNLLLLPESWFHDQPPAGPYLFFGLHMQPESSIDVWAPYFSDQRAVIEAIARSMPPTHRLLVKLHKSDADNYSLRELEQFRRLPGVELVSPYAQSRTFIERADVVLAIQGNIAMEAALLGKPVLMFGDSPFLEMPSVTRVGRVTDLARQIREKLDGSRPERSEIVSGLTAYLRHYAPGCYNDWEEVLGASEVTALANHFSALAEALKHDPARFATHSSASVTPFVKGPTPACAE